MLPASEGWTGYSEALAFLFKETRQLEPFAKKSIIRSIVRTQVAGVRMDLTSLPVNNLYDPQIADYNARASNALAFPAVAQITTLYR